MGYINLLQPKLTNICIGDCRSMLRFTPFGTVFDNLTHQSLLETDVSPHFLGFDPFVFQNLFALGLELAIKR